MFQAQVMAEFVGHVSNVHPFEQPGPGALDIANSGPVARVGYVRKCVDDVVVRAQVHACGRGSFRVVPGRSGLGLHDRPKHRARRWVGPSKPKWSMSPFAASVPHTPEGTAIDVAWAAVIGCLLSPEKLTRRTATLLVPVAGAAATAGVTVLIPSGATAIVPPLRVPATVTMLPG